MDKVWSPLSDADFARYNFALCSEHYLGKLGELNCVAHEVELPAENIAAGEECADLQFHNLRSLLFKIDSTQFTIAARGKNIINWHNQHRFCGACGTTTETHTADRAKVCTACNLTFYPRISPCVIVLITKGEELLLARNANFPEGVYSTLAGFIEAGETVEQALHREVFEEVGVRVKNLRYFSSQPWPFPHQLMLGFFAEYDSGEINVDGIEIAEAKWWRYDELPFTPPKISISGQLIAQYVAQLSP